MVTVGCHEVPNCANETPEVADTLGDCCARNNRVSFGGVDGNCLPCLSMLYIDVIAAHCSSM